MDDWQQLMELSDDELASVDIAKQNLLCAKGLPGAENLNVSRCLRKIDRWTEIVRRYTLDHWYLYNRNPSEFRNSQAFYQMVGLITVLQKELGVFYRTDMMDGAVDWRDSRTVFINGLLSGHGGTCTSLPVLYVAVGRRLGYPLHLVGTRAHGFCRWEGKNERFNIEGAAYGMLSHPDEHYHDWPIPIKQHEISQGWYLHNQTPRESLAWFISERAGVLRDNRRFGDAVKHYFHARTVWPYHPFMQVAHGVSTILFRFAHGLARYEFEKKTNRLTRVYSKKEGWREPQPWEPGSAIQAQKEFRRIQKLHGLAPHPADKYLKEQN